MVVLLMLGSGCAARHGGPVLGGSTTPERTGTVSGTVRAADGSPLSGRRVSAIDMATEAHYDATTAASGGFTIIVPSGKYRLEVELRGGDVIATQPAPTDVNVGDLDAQLDFVIAR
jgi:hypothetical protein